MPERFNVDGATRFTSVTCPACAGKRFKIVANKPRSCAVCRANGTVSAERAKWFIEGEARNWGHKRLRKRRDIVLPGLD